MKKQKVCPQCAVAFEGRNNQVYCSSNCKQQAFQQRQGKPEEVATSPTTSSTQIKSNSPTKALYHLLPSVSPKAAVEIEKIRAESDEKKRRSELEERKQERLFEQANNKRKHKQALELIERTNQAASTKWEAEKAKLYNRLDAMENEATLAPVQEQPQKEEEDEQDSKINVGAVVVAGVIGAIIWASMKANPDPKPNPKPLGMVADKIPVEGLLNFGKKAKPRSS